MSCEPTPADLALVEAARRARLNAHAPMSGYHVGAALRTPDGDVITGCNVEDILLNLGCCAERVALFKAISDGYRQFEAVAVVTQGRPAAAPCGACRQLLASWKIERVVIATDDLEVPVEVLALSDLLPRFFHLRPESEED